MESLSLEDQKFYKEAVSLALKAMDENEVPVGCVFVYDGEIIGRGHNEVNKRGNPTLHAEIVGVEHVTKWAKWNNKDVYEIFRDCDLYVNLEPCCMCSSALYQLHIKRVIFGAPNDRFGGMGSVLSNEEFKHDHEIEIVKNVDVERSIQMLKDFYKRENPFAPPEKRKTRGKVPAKEGFE